MTVKTLYATQDGGSAVYDTMQKAHFFIEVPKCGDFKVGDPVPKDWSVTLAAYSQDVETQLVSVGEVEDMNVTERDGYEAGYAGKTDPNPFMVDSYNYWLYAAGRARGDKERLALDNEVTQ